MNMFITYREYNMTGYMRVLMNLNMSICLRTKSVSVRVSFQSTQSFFSWMNEKRVKNHNHLSNGYIADKRILQFDWMPVFGL